MSVKGTAPRPRRPSVRELRARLAEAEETLRAIRGGAVDAFVVRTRHGDQVFALQGADHPYRVLVEQMEEGAATVSTEGTILYANRRLAAMLRTPLRRVTGASIYGCISEPDQPAVRVLLKGGRTGAHRAEATLCAADGTSVPVALAANPVRIEGVETVCLILTDLTTRKQAEERLQLYANEISDLYDHAPCGYHSLDRGGTFVRINDTELQWLGYTRDEIAGRKKFSDVMTAASQEVFRENFPRLVKGRDVMDLELQLVRKDGSMLPVLLNATAVRDASGQVVRIRATVVDLTARKQAEDNARRHQAELAHVLRLSTMGELAAELAHGINQPLAAIANDVAACATYVRSGNAASRKLLELLERAAAEALGAGDIVHHLREFAQKRGSHLEATNLNGLVRNVARLLEREIVQREITLRLDLAPRPIPVHADRVEIEQVLVNLIQNAIDAVGEAASERKQIHVQTRKTEDAMAEVTVRDIGTGLSDAAAARLFEAFFTTKKRGLGMGLAISRSIIEAHHGRIWIDPRAGDARGTTVRFALPLQGPERRSRRTRS